MCSLTVIPIINVKKIINVEGMRELEKSPLLYNNPSKQELSVNKSLMRIRILKSIALIKYLCKFKDNQKKQALIASRGVRHT